MLAQGTTLGEYEIVRPVATGATSDVYEARHRGTGQRAAAKILRAHWCIDEGIVKRFLNEALVLRQLAHPHVVTILDRGHLPEGRPFMLLEWMPTDLHRALSRAGGPLPPQLAIEIATKIARGLCALHARAIVHRDVKPANVLLAGEDLAPSAVKLADLGLAKLFVGNAPGSDASGAANALDVSTGQRVVFGTWEYMPPEQWVQSKTVDCQADVYSLGAVLFQMLAGRLPFVANREADWMYHHVVDVPPVGLLDRRAPARVRDLVAAMLGKKAPARPTMPEVVEILDKAA